MNSATSMYLCISHIQLNILPITITAMEPRVCKRFSSLTPTTIAYISGDNTIFHVERVKVPRAADLMPLSDADVHLPESAAVLELLFRFIYCEVNIPLDTILFPIVNKLAEAADTYMVHSARSACHQYMRTQYKDHPLEIAAYAVKHGCEGLLNLAMPYTAGIDLATVQSFLPDTYVLTWALYSSRFQTIMHNVINLWIPPREHALEESEVGAEEEEEYDDEDYGAGENPACQLGESADGTWSWIERNVALAMLRAPAWGLLDLDKVFTVDMLRSVEGFSEATPTSVAFVSSDNVTFYVDRAKLDRAADFSPPELVSSTPTDPVRLSEKSKTLDLLFRFVYCDVNLDLDTYPFLDIADFAMAAEKYQVFSAMAVCRLYMKGKMQSHPARVMAYAARNGHNDILNAVAPYTLAVPAREMYNALPPAYMIAWVLYCAEYQKIAREAIAYFPDFASEHIWSGATLNLRGCGQEDMNKSWLGLQSTLMKALLVDGPATLLDLDKVFTEELYEVMSSCGTCYERLHRYETELQQGVDEVAEFTHFLRV
ncbi:uncharacterized protein SCHCODRAFT_02499117 [Schizophyllum commune H4-8]|nr:uncharacterized protein SCHCODRAFT_02499117 [Schizophyllum commune H4-8]KAI5892980.1 hypothetical protein SCHCODRAFT_02499117 [Schizophyllum commune H4-8]